MKSMKVYQRIIKISKLISKKNNSSNQTDILSFIFNQNIFKKEK